MCDNQVSVGGRHLCWQQGGVGVRGMHRNTETRNLFLISCCFLFFSFPESQWVRFPMNHLHRSKHLGRLPRGTSEKEQPACQCRRHKRSWLGRSCVKLLVTQSCPTLCDPMNCRPPGFSVHGILQVRTLEWVAVPFSRGSSQPRDQTLVSCIAGRFFEPPGHFLLQCMKVKSESEVA